VTSRVPNPKGYDIENIVEKGNGEIVGISISKTEFENLDKRVDVNSPYCLVVETQK